MGSRGREGASEVAKYKNCLKAVNVVRYLDPFPSSMILGDCLSSLAGHGKFILWKEKPRAWRCEVFLEDYMKTIFIP